MYLELLLALIIGKLLGFPVLRLSRFATLLLLCRRVLPDSSMHLNHIRLSTTPSYLAVTPLPVTSALQSLTCSSQHACSYGEDHCCSKPMAHDPCRVQECWAAGCTFHSYVNICDTNEQPVQTDCRGFTLTKLMYIYRKVHHGRLHVVQTH